MPRVELVGVPFDGLGRHGGQREAPRALRAAGLGDRPGVALRADLDLPDSSRDRGAHGLLNEAAFGAMVDAVGAAVLDAESRGVVPLLYGGDCASLLGSVPALAREGPPVGLVCLDAHEDATAPDVSTTGEVANMEVGVLAGLHTGPLPAPLAAAAGTVPAHRVALLGVRDAPWRGSAVPSVRERVGLHRTADDVASDPAAAAVRAVEQVGPRPWVHVDLDVLSRASFGACGDPSEPELAGGLTWRELGDCVARVLEEGSCVGLSVAVYNPDLDPTGADARDVVAFVRAACDSITG